MIKTGEIASRLDKYLASAGEDLRVEEVRIGLGYVGVRIEGERRIGLAAVLRSELSPCCSVLAEAGHLAGLSVSVLLSRLVEGKNPLEKALGLATANALIAPGPPLMTSSPDDEENDAIGLINLTPQDKVAMIGLFSPLVSRIEKSGAALSIIERNETMRGVPLVHLPEDQETEIRRKILQECTVAIITATSILNDTLEEVLNGLGTPRHVLILGPSTPLCAEVFRGTPVTHLGGSAVLDEGKVMQIVSEGGGTRQLRPFLRFVNVAVRG
ncbi:MAG: DUF364 domain-containing protein [bacterium]